MYCCLLRCSRAPRSLYITPAPGNKDTCESPLFWHKHKGGESSEWNTDCGFQLVFSSCLEVGINNLSSKRCPGFLRLSAHPASWDVYTTEADPWRLRWEYKSLQPEVGSCSWAFNSEGPGAPAKPRTATKNITAVAVSLPGTFSLRSLNKQVIHYYVHCI